MLRILGVLAVVAVLATAAYGSASALIVDGGPIQAGEDNELVCDEDGIYISAWGLNTYASDLEGVEYVTIKGVHSACNGARLMGRIATVDSVPGNQGTYFYTSGTSTYASGYSFVVANGDSSTEYTLYFKEADYDTQVWLPAEDIVGVKFWIEGK